LQPPLAFDDLELNCLALFKRSVAIGQNRALVHEDVWAAFTLRGRATRGAAKAIAALDGKEVGGRNLKVNEARPKGERPPRSNSGGGRPAGGRGRSGFSHEDYRESASQPREPRW